MHRRQYLMHTTFAAATFAAAGRRLDAKPMESSYAESNVPWLMPDEAAKHKCTWMSFGATQRIWGRTLLAPVRQSLAELATTIANYEPVKLLVRRQERELTGRLVDEHPNIELLECPLNDLWIRDHGAIYVTDRSGGKAAVDFNFNGWGEKQEFARDAQVAAFMADTSKVRLIPTELCLEGGGIEVDGQGTAIITESCVLNRNRNPGWSKRDCEAELLRTLGIEKVIWLPGIRGADITDGHTDFYARFATPSVVVAHLDPDRSSPDHLLTHQQIELLSKASDARGRRLKVIPLESPTRIRPKFASEEFCAGYINVYVCNHAVIVPEFGDRNADGAAQEKLQSAFPDREIVPLNIDAIAAGGGGIHCATQQEPEV